MSLDMDISALLQTEMLRVPTQLIFVDFTPSQSIHTWFTSFDLKKDSFVDIIQLEKSEQSNFSSSFVENEILKSKYIIYRPTLLQSIFSKISERTAQGTKERTVVFFIGCSDNEYSSLLLREFPIDFSNFSNWRTRHLPGIIRIVLYGQISQKSNGSSSLPSKSKSSSQQLFNKAKRFLRLLSSQYFEMARFDTKPKPNESKPSHSGDISDMNSSSTQTTVKSTKSEKPKITDNFSRKNGMSEHIKCSQYDICLLSETEDCIQKILKKIIPMHKMEVGYVMKNMSAEIGSGGSLYLLEGRLVSSVSSWRRLDWLVLAQVDYMPRLWVLDKTKTLEEFVNLLDYRFWLGRFKELDESESDQLELVSYPDSKANELEKKLAKASKQQQFHRRKREANWTLFLKQSKEKFYKDHDDDGNVYKMNEEDDSDDLEDVEDENCSESDQNDDDELDMLLNDIPQTRAKESKSKVGKQVKKTSSKQSKSSSRKNLASSTPIQKKNSSINDDLHIGKLNQKSNSDTMILEASLSEIWNPILAELNPYRVSPGDFPTMKELVLYLQKRKEALESLEVIHTIVKKQSNSPKFVSNSFDFPDSSHPSIDPSHHSNHSLSLNNDIPKEFLKLEGLALLSLGKKEESRKLFFEYRKHLEQEEDDRRLLGISADVGEQAKTWAEVAGVCFASSDFEAAIVCSMKALKLDSKCMGAYKTLVWSSIRTGSSSFEQEDFVFTFFASHLRDAQKAEEYYKMCTDQYPHNGFFWYGYAMFCFVLCGQFSKAEPLFEKCYQLLPNEARILESYATFLFQSHSSKLALIDQLYSKAHQIDPENLIASANSSAFHLYFASIQKLHLDSLSNKLDDEYQEILKVFKNSSYIPNDEVKVNEKFEDALLLLESVLFSTRLMEEHPQVYLECWFYVICYTDDLSRLETAMTHVKAALRKGVRARSWDMSMHLVALKRRSVLPKEEIVHVRLLLDVINDKEQIDALERWNRWKQLASDALVKSIKLGTNAFRVCVTPSKRREEAMDKSPGLKSQGLLPKPFSLKEGKNSTTKKFGKQASNLATSLNQKTPDASKSDIEKQDEALGPKIQSSKSDLSKMSPQIAESQIIESKKTEMMLKGLSPTILSTNTPVLKSGKTFSKRAFSAKSSPASVTSPTTLLSTPPSSGLSSSSSTTPSTTTSLSSSAGSKQISVEKSKPKSVLTDAKKSNKQNEQSSLNDPSVEEEDIWKVLSEKYDDKRNVVLHEVVTPLLGQRSLSLPSSGWNLNTSSVSEVDKESRKVKSTNSRLVSTTTKTTTLTSTSTSTSTSTTKTSSSTTTTTNKNFDGKITTMKWFSDATKSTSSLQDSVSNRTRKSPSSGGGDKQPDRLVSDELVSDIPKSAPRTKRQRSDETHDDSSRPSKSKKIQESSTPGNS